MTVANASPYNDTVAAEGSVEFPFTMRTLSSEWIKVYTDGELSVIGKTITLNPNQDVFPGGNVVFDTPPGAGVVVRVAREVPLAQETVLDPYSLFSAKTVEQALDRIVMQNQQINADLVNVGADLSSALTAEEAARAAQDAVLAAAVEQARADFAAGGGGFGDATGITAAGSVTSRSLAARFADVVNVRDFGAKGDGVTDDTAAIQAAITAATRGAPTFSCSVFIPPGNYLVTSPILLPDRALRIVGAGASSYIFGTFDDYIFKRASAAAVEGPMSVEDLFLSNASRNADLSGCILWYGFIGGLIRNCRLVGQNGVKGVTNDFTMAVEGCRVLRTQSPTSGTSRGITMVGHASVRDCDVVGHDIGIDFVGVCNNIHGGRFEVNKTAIKTIGAQRCSLGGMSFEANDTALDLQLLISSHVSAFVAQGTGNAPAGMSQVGMAVSGCYNTTFSGITMGGQHNDAAIKLVGNINCTFLGVRASNVAGKRIWDVQANLQASTFLDCFFQPHGTGSSETSVDRLIGPAAMMGISQLDLVNGTVQAKNFRGKAVPVTAAATFKDIVFPPAWGSGSADINTATAGTGGTLAAGTYYYRASLVTETGETGVNLERSATVDGVTTNAVDLLFYGVAPVSGGSFRRRVYRGTAPGVYDGYFDLPVNGGATWKDTGAAYTGLKRPIQSSSLAPLAGPEVDANYAIFASPAWNTAYWITAKATTGFRINFATPPGADSSVDWLLVR
jgi:hypothetical protein